jgi:hypothetical protein
MQMEQRPFEAGCPHPGLPGGLRLEADGLFELGTVVKCVVERDSSRGGIERTMGHPELAN